MYHIEFSHKTHHLWLFLLGFFLPSNRILNHSNFINILKKKEHHLAYELKESSVSSVFGDHMGSAELSPQFLPLLSAC